MDLNYCMSELMAHNDSYCIYDSHCLSGLGAFGMTPDDKIFQAHLTDFVPQT